jgi:23S rRNA (cytidine1920-2'-O)/16S rRNA (cytidine1409-2'-O)-methyltransferase
VAAARVRAIERLAAYDPDTGREELVAQIMCGDVRFDGQTVRDPKESVPSNSAVSYRESGFVGRGGIKLDHALGLWDLHVSGKVVVDAGASTGGFTHALLLRGVARVHAVDVGVNQLAYSIRVDPRVVVHEKTNVMDLTGLTPVPDFAVADLSFRSLCGAAAHLLDLTTERWGIVLLKPQFEWRDPPEDFDGRVPQDAVDGIVAETLERLSGEGVYSHGITESPIRGRSGNREFLVLVRDVAAGHASGSTS